MRLMLTILAMAVITACATGPEPYVTGNPSVPGDVGDGSDEPLAAPGAEPPGDSGRLESGGGGAAADDCVNTSTFECVALFYGTNRQRRLSDLSGQRVFEPVATDATTFGRLTITVPRSRRENIGGKIPMIANERKRVTNNDRGNVFAIWDDQTLAREWFIEISREELAADPAKKKAIVYVHGFNTTFRNASFRAAQIKYDLEFEGPVYFFSWPANGQGGGEALDYLSDLDDADLSAAPLAEFLLTVRETVGADTKIYAIAHSMGTRVFMNALRDISFRSGGKNGERPLINRLVLAAGDLDRSVFLSWLDKTQAMIGDLTIYASDKDKALRGAIWLRNLLAFGNNDPKTRIGIITDRLGPTILDQENAVTIDISKYDERMFSALTSLRHADYIENNIGLKDIEALVNDAPLDPELRDSRYKRRCAGAGRAYWVFGARGRPSGNC